MEEISFKVLIEIQLKYAVEIRHRTMVLDNVKLWQVFNYYQEIERFLETINEFSDSQIDEDNGVDEGRGTRLLNTIVDHDNIELKCNFLTKRLVPLKGFSIIMM